MRGLRLDGVVIIGRGGYYCGGVRLDGVVIIGRGGYYW